MSRRLVPILFFFFLNDPATTEIYPLPLPDALPISFSHQPTTATAGANIGPVEVSLIDGQGTTIPTLDRKSTRLNSSHGYISYAVFCLKKKKKTDFKANLTKMKRGASERARCPTAHM